MTPSQPTSQHRNPGAIAEGQPLRLAVDFRTKPGSEEALRQILVQLTEQTLKEAGCIAFDIYGVANNPRQFLLLEVWSNQEALDSHFRTDHFKIANNQYEALLERSLEESILHLAPLGEGK